MICCRCHTALTGYSEPWSYPPGPERVCLACLNALTSDVLTLLAAARLDADEEETCEN